jgi:putative phage-type endonuclease
MGGSDVAAALGMSRFKAPIDVFEEKTGRAPETQSSEAMDWGNLLEAPLRDHYAKRHNVHVEVPGQLQHQALPWALGSPDGIVLRSTLLPDGNGALWPVAHRWSHCLEVKATEIWMADQWGPAGTDQVPIEYLIQAAWYLAVTDLERWDLTVAIGRQIRDYVLRRDRELEDMLIDGAGEFWEKHVLADVPPTPDGTKSYRRHLERRFPEHVEKVIASTREQDELVAQYREARLVAVEADQKAEALKQRIQLEMADAAVLDSVHGRITWRRCKDSTATDWHRVAQELAQLAHLAPEDLDGLAARFRVVTRPGSRRFNVPRSWSKESE